MKLPIYSSVADAKILPKLIQVKDNLIVVSFEWMKIMTVQFVIKKLLNNGKIRPGDTVIDSSSGVYAYSLALVCKQYGLNCVIVGSSAINEKLKIMLELIGTKIYIIPAETPKDSELNRIKFIKEYLSKHPQTIWMGQYFNKDHYEGYQLLADILINSIEKNFTLVTAVGSGCSACGTIYYLRKHFDAKLIGVERFGSHSFGLLKPSTDFSTTITGIGASILMPNVTAADFDVIHWLDAKLAAYGALRLYQETGIFGGHSTGAVY